MRQLSQRELLDEGFWDGFKKVAGGVGRAAKGALKAGATAATVGGRLVDIALPEVTKPIKGAVSAFRDVKNAGKSAWATLRPIMDKIKQQLEDQGFVLDESIPLQKSGKNSIIFAHKITGYDKNKQEFIWDDTKTTTFIVDTEGNVKIAPGGEKPVPSTPAAAPTGTSSPGPTPPPVPPTPTTTPPKPTSTSPSPSTPSPTRTPKPRSSPTSGKRKP